MFEAVGIPTLFARRGSRIPGKVRKQDLARERSEKQRRPRSGNTGPSARPDMLGDEGAFRASDDTFVLRKLFVYQVPYRVLKVPEVPTPLEPPSLRTLLVLTGYW